MQIINKAIGIDLGTTNSAVGIMNPADNEVILFRDDSNRETTPSCVWRNPDAPDAEKFVVGFKAFCRRGTSPAPVRSFKRLMGKNVKMNLGGGCYKTPVELSADVLKEMKRQIDTVTKTLDSNDARWEVTRAIVTVPAYFDDPEVNATRQAAEQSGLELLELLHEPTAAAIYHCWRTNARNGVFMVFDLGGGTFDVTVLKITAGAPTVVGLSGHTHLGGDDIDTEIAEKMKEQLIREGFAMDLQPDDPDDILRFELLKYLAEGIKKRLSDDTEYVLRDGTTLKDKNGRQVIFNTVYERKQVAEWMKPVIERTIPYCNTALQLAENKAGIKLEDIDEIILAGGSTHIPAVRERVRKEFCKLSQAEFSEFVAERKRDGDASTIHPQDKRCKGERPVYEKVDTIVALGASIRAGAFGGLHLTDPEGMIRVELQGLGLSDKAEKQVMGYVRRIKSGNSAVSGTEPGGSGQSFEGCKICIYIPESGFEHTTDLGADGHFVFNDVPVNPNGESVFNFEILDGNDECIAIVARSIRRGDKVSSNAPLVTLPKAISMDIEGDAGVERMLLIPALEALPANKKFILTHPGNTDVVRFRLYQRSRFIKEVTVPVSSSLPRGTEINLNINIDNFSFITVQGKIGDKPFDAVIDPPPPRPQPTAEDVSALESSFREGLDYLEAGPKMAKEASFKQTYKAYQAAAARKNEDQALHEFEELEDIVSGVARTKVVLKPARLTFDNRVKEVYELIDAGRTLLESQNKSTAQVADWKAKADDYRAAGDKAYKESNQKEWGEVILQLGKLQNYIITEVRSNVQLSSDMSHADMASARLQRIAKRLEELSNDAQAVGDNQSLSDIHSLGNQLRDASTMAESDPKGALDRISRIEQGVKSVESRLQSLGVSDDRKGLPGMARR